jgi:hypothetical protein
MLNKNSISQWLISYLVYTVIVSMATMPIWVLLICLGGVSPWFLLTMPVVTLLAMFGMVSKTMEE